MGGRRQFVRNAGCGSKSGIGEPECRGMTSARRVETPVICIIECSESYIESTCPGMNEGLHPSSLSQVVYRPEPQAALHDYLREGVT